MSNTVQRFQILAQPHIRIVAIALSMLVFSIFFRLYQFGELPLSLNRDEASIAYNAWTISQEGTDEWGVHFPFMFRAFGDYKLPGYIYTLSVFNLVLEPSPLVTRLPSLLAGLISIIVLAQITARIFNSSQAAWIAAALVSVSPWAIFYSRTAFEANLALTWTLVGVWLLLIGTDRPRLLFLVAPVLWLASITYNAALLLSIPIIFFWLVFLGKKIFTKHKIIFMTLVISVIGVTALTGYVQYQSFITKSNTSIFFDPTHVHRYMELRGGADSLIERIVYNRTVYFTGILISQYAQTLSPQFLVQGVGGHPWHSAPGTGYLHVTVYILAVIGVVLVLKNPLRNRAVTFILFVMFAAALPSAITVDAPHATRSLLLLALAVISATYACLYLIEKRRLRFLVTIAAAAIVLETMLYARHYFVLFPKQHHLEYQVGLMEALSDVPRDDRPVVITDTGWYGYVYVLLAENISASEYQRQVVHSGIDQVGYSLVGQVGRYYFTNDPASIEGNPYVISPNESREFVLTQL